MNLTKSKKLCSLATIFCTLIYLNIPQVWAGEKLTIEHIVTHDNGEESVLYTEEIDNLTDVFYYNPVLSPVAAELTFTGYRPIDGVFPVIEADAAAGDDTIHIRYKPALEEVQVHYYEAVDGGDIELGVFVDKVTVDEDFIPELPLNGAYEYVKIEPDNGLHGVRNTGENTVKVILSQQYREGFEKIGFPELLYIYYLESDTQSVLYETVLDNNKGAYTHEAPNEIERDDGTYQLDEQKLKTLSQKDMGVLTFNYSKVAQGTATSSDNYGGLGAILPKKQQEGGQLPQNELVSTGLLNKTPFLSGYPDGTFKPEKPLTCAETAVLFYQLADDPDKSNPQANQFSDLEGEEWYAHAANYLAANGMLVVSQGQSFHGDQPVTRGMFMDIASNLDSASAAKIDIYDDVRSNYWMLAYIYSDEAHPTLPVETVGNYYTLESNLSRAEASVLVNQMIGAKIEVAEQNNKVFGDLDENHWAYFDILYASGAQ